MDKELLKTIEEIKDINAGYYNSFKKEVKDLASLFLGHSLDIKHNEKDLEMLKDLIIDNMIEIIVQEVEKF